MDLTLVDTCIDRQIEHLQNLRAVVRTGVYSTVIDLLTEVASSNYTRRIIVAGVGKNSFIAEKCTATMASLGIPSMPLNITHCSHGDFGAVGHNDVIIHVSRSGKTQEMLEAIRYISRIRPEVEQVLLHCNSNKASSDANYEIFCGNVVEGDAHALAPTTSTTVLLCMLDTISVEVSSRIGFHKLDFYKYHPGGSLGASFKVGFVYRDDTGVHTCVQDPRVQLAGKIQILEFGKAEDLESLKEKYL